MPEHGHERSSSLSEINAGVARVVSERWGRGPQKARAMWADPNTLLVLLEDGHTTAEQTLRAAGHAETVLGTRSKLQAIIEHDVAEVVEIATGRTVEAVLTATRMEPDLSAEIFLLATLPSASPADGPPPAASRPPAVDG